MSSFTLQQDGFTSYTCVANTFIEKYMPKAAGEFVKIYIYLLKCVEESRSELSISRIADAFEDTQKDVIRALKYWEKKGLLKLSFDGDILTSLKIVQLSDEEPSSEDSVSCDIPEDVVVKAADPVPAKKSYSGDESSALMCRADVSQLIYAVQRYLGKTLSVSEVNTVLYFIDGLKLPVDVIDYLFEYCVTKGKTSFRYIEKTAIAWAEKGFKTINDAKAENMAYNKTASSVMKAFGLNDRKPAAKELECIEKWSSYGFDTELIKEACSRTINQIHKPSFDYAEKILEKWKNSGVKSMADVSALDEIHEQKAAAAREKEKSAANKNKFHNFSQRSDDMYIELEKVIFD